MNKARHWSIATRLTVVFALAVAGIQFAASLFLYVSLKHDLLDKDQATLAEHIREVRLVMADNGAPNKRIPPPQGWEAHILSRPGIFMRVSDAQGGEITQTPGLIAPPEAFPPPAGLRDLPTASVRWHPPGKREEFLLMAAEARSGGSGRRWVIQAAMDLKPSEEELQAYQRKLAFVWLAVVSSVIGIGYLGIRRELRGVRRIALAASRINANHFEELLSDQPMPGELQDLASVFDAMVLRLRHAFEQLSRFSSDLAHEFRTPLNNLVNAASVTLSRDRSTAEYREMIEASMDEYQALNRMIEAILFLARAENQQMPLRTQRVSAAAEFEKQAEFFEALADDKGVRLLRDGDAELIVDPVLLRRALSNLIANGLRYTNRGGSITLHAEPAPAGGARLVVSDTGLGIDRAHLPHLFERFYQVDAARSDESTGLGLAIVKSIVTLHGGTVDVQSEPGLGTTFTIEFPRPTSDGG